MTDSLKELGSCLSKLRVLMEDGKKDLQRIQAIENSLEGVLRDLWKNAIANNMNCSPSLWKELISLVTSGRILSAAAQAEQLLHDSNAERDKHWFSDGQQYAAWLGRGIAQLTENLDVAHSASAFKELSSLLSKSFSLGYTGTTLL